MIFSGFGENYKDITITNGSTGAILLKSISIYFKTELEQVAAPVISCEGNVVTIGCATEGASVVYSVDGSEPSEAYDGPFAITETCTVRAKATKEGMAGSEVAEKECVYEAPAVKPGTPVVSVGGAVVAGEEFSVDYGTKVSVSAENATSLRVEYGSESQVVEGNTYEFAATADETYIVTPLNDKMPERDQEGDAAMFTIAINAPEILAVMNGEAAIKEYGSIVAKAGTEITVETKSCAEITVDNDGFAVAVTDGKFAIANEGSYIITASNPARQEKAEWMFEVTIPEEPEYEVNETLSWDITGVANGNAATANCDTRLNKGDGSANGDWTAIATKCYYGSNNGAQLGSGSGPFVNGTLTLSGSDIPADATITAVSMKGIPGNVDMAWELSVNGVKADGQINFPKAGTNYGKANHQTKTIDGLELAGNEIVLTMVSAGGDKAFYLSGISVSYYVLAEPEAPSFVKDEVMQEGSTIVYTVKHGKIHYHIEDASAANGSMLRVSAPTDGWTEAKENGGKQFTYEYAAGSNHNIYVKNVVNGKEALGEAINVNTSGIVTGVEDVAAEGAAGVRELYNLQGVRVSEADAVPGVYIERRGGRVAKVVL